MKLTPCACGCGKPAPLRPSFHSKQCQVRYHVRNWRKSHPEAAKAQARKDAASYRKRSRAKP